MLEKKYKPRYTAEVSKVYTGGPLGWDHVVDRNNLDAYMPSLSRIPVKYNSDDVGDFYATYNPVDDTIRVKGASLTNGAGRYGLMANDEEYTHAARLQVAPFNNARKKKNDAAKIEFIKNNPSADFREFYVKDPEEIIAHTAGYTALGNTQKEVLDILDKAYNKNGIDYDLITKVMNSSKPVEEKVKIANAISGTLPRNLEELRRRVEQ